MTQPPSPSAAALEAAKTWLALGLPALPHQVGGKSTYSEWIDWLAKFADAFAAQAVAAAHATANLGWHDAAGEWHAGPTGPNEDVAGAAERAKPAASDREAAAKLYAQLPLIVAPISAEGRVATFTVEFRPQLTAGQVLELLAAALAERGEREPQ